MNQIEHQINDSANVNRNLCFRGRASLTAFAIFWVALGQVVMLSLVQFDAGSKAIFTQLADAVSLVIPTVKSVSNSAVFNVEIGRIHHSLLWLASLPLCIALFFSARLRRFEALNDITEKRKPALLAGIFFVLAVMNALLDYYSGFYTFGLNKYWWGFALCSSVSSFVFPISAWFAGISCAKF